jgi:hypothetical protein
MERFIGGLGQETLSANPHRCEHTMATGRSWRLVASCLRGAAATLAVILLSVDCHRVEQPAMVGSADLRLPDRTSPASIEQLSPLSAPGPAREGDTGSPGVCGSQLAPGPLVSGLISEVNGLREGSDYRPTILGGEKPPDQPSLPEFGQADWSYRYTLWANSRDQWSPSSKLSKSAFLPDGLGADRPETMPELKWDVRFTSQFDHEFSNGWTGGGGVSIGSISDRPFNSWDESTARVRVFLQAPQRKRGAWLFILSQLRRGDQSASVSRLEWIWQPSEQFQAHLGLVLPKLGDPLEEPSLDLLLKLLWPTLP